MLEKIYNWCIEYQDNISWFFVGMLSTATYYSLAEGDFVMAAVYAVLAYFNYFATKFRMQ